MTIKIGILGCSSIAQRMVIPAIINSQEFVLAGVASRSSSKAASFAQTFETTAHTYEGLLSEDIDAVYISVPVGLHYYWGKRVLENNKHLLLEKTFTETHAQAVELFQISRDRQLACIEALMYRYHPLQAQLTTAIEDLGKIQHVEAHFGFPHFNDRSDIRYSKDLGGGAALDSLIYPLSFIFGILGTEYVDHKASLYYDKISGVDERGYIHLEYEDASAALSYGFGHSYRNEITVWGSDGILKLQRAFSRPSTCTTPIDIWTNNVHTAIETVQSDHFVDMLSAFAGNVETLNNNSTDTLSRIWFIEKILNSKGEKL